MQKCMIFLWMVCFGPVVVAQPNNGARENRYKYDFVVAKDGSGEFTSIQDAINGIRAFSTKPITIHIRKGVYIEKILLPAWNTNVSFIGDNAENTIISFNDYSGRGSTITFTSYTVKICGNDFYAENITFLNASGPVGQAVAMHVEADRCIFKNCRFLGNQDTIYAANENARQLFIDCYIEGTTDFIFGPATAVFRRCTIHSKANSFITAPNTPEGIRYGFVFIDCTVTADTSVHQVYLGRPWRGYAKSAFIRCNLGKHIVPAGWDNWQAPESEKTAVFAEYNCTGEGAGRSNRVLWSKNLSDAEAEEYLPERIFSGTKASSQAEKEWYKRF